MLKILAQETYLPNLKLKIMMLEAECLFKQWKLVEKLRIISGLQL